MSEKKGIAISGWVNFDKPVGMTSTEAVGYIKRLFNAQKAGHGGTLDPLASGVLPIGLGEATKLMPYSLEADKSYTFTLQFGTQTTTDDTEGEALHTSAARPTREDMENCLLQFLGDITQTPPQFSAIKIDGKPAYAQARAGQEVKLKARDVTVYGLAITDFTGETCTLDCKVSKGTYVRSLARDIGERLGCYAHIVQLRRTQAGVFGLETCTPQEKLDSLSQSVDNTALRQHALLPLATILDGIPEYVAAPAEVRDLRLGRTFDRVHVSGGTKQVITQHGQLVALVEVNSQGKFKILRNINPDDAHL